MPKPLNSLLKTFFQLGAGAGAGKVQILYCYGAVVQILVGGFAL
jgi:hypothetical protein